MKGGGQRRGSRAKNVSEGTRGNSRKQGVNGEFTQIVRVFGLVFSKTNRGVQMGKMSI